MSTAAFYVASVLIAAVSAVSQASAQRRAENRAKEQAELEREQIRKQEEEARLARELEQKKQQRAARARAATVIQAAGGAGVGGSVVSSPLISGQTSLSSSLETIDQFGELQSEQFGIAKDQVGVRERSAIDEANAALWRSVFSTAGSVTNTLAEADFGTTSEP